MQAELFLENFERLVSAPGGIQKLRGLILQLAVQGKLVPQVASDEPARKFLTGSCSTKKSNADYFHLLPKGWLFAPLTVFGDFRGGLTPSKARSEYWGEGIDWVSPKDMAGDAGHRITSAKDQVTELALSDTTLSKIPPNSILMVARSGILKRKFPVATTGVECTVNQDMKALILREPSIARFLQIMLLGWEPRILRDFVKTGTTVQSLKFSEFKSSLWPIPPLAEQKRIVAKVDELMALCDRLEEQRAKHTTLKRAVAKSTLHHIAHTPDPLSIGKYWGMLNEKFDDLFDDIDTVNFLRGAACDLAIFGRLGKLAVDSSCYKNYFEKIRNEIDMHAKKKIIRRPKTVSGFDKAELPELPPNWRWIQLGEICLRVADGPHFSPKYVSEEDGIPFLSTRNIAAGYIDFSGAKFVSRSDHEEFCKRIRPKHGDILYTKGGTTGIAAVNSTRREFSIWVHIAVLQFNQELTIPKYLALVLNSPHCYGQSQKFTHGTGNRDLGLTRLINITLPLPPREMQLRVVEEVERIFSLCSDLEAGISNDMQLTASLMGSLVHNLTQTSYNGALDPQESTRRRLETKSTPIAAPNVVSLPRKRISPPTLAAGQSMSVDSKFQEAVLVGAIVKAFFDDGGEPIGNFRLQKAVYFARRHGGEKALDEEYLKKAAGPYNPKMKYSGGIAIAKKKGYIREARGRYGFGHIVGSKADELSDYLGRDQYAPFVEAANWVRDTFKFKKNDDWERLATVDYAILDLESRGGDVTGQAILNYIRSDAEWAPKIAKLGLTAARLDNLIHDTRTLFATVGQANGG